MNLEIFHGQTFDDGGHAHAMKVAKKLCDDTLYILKQTLGRAGAGGSSIVRNYELGTKAGLAFLDAYFGKQVEPATND